MPTDVVARSIFLAFEHWLGELERIEKGDSTFPENAHLKEVGVTGLWSDFSVLVQAAIITPDLWEEIIGFVKKKNGVYTSKIALHALTALREIAELSMAKHKVLQV